MDVAAMASQPVSFGALVVMVLLAAGAIWAFQAAFKSGTRETKVDAWFDKILADPQVPSGVKALAQKAKELELTKAAGEIKAFVDPRVDQILATLEELKTKLPK